MDKNKRYVFCFIRAESHVKGVKIFLEKSRFFLLEWISSKLWEIEKMF